MVLTSACTSSSGGEKEKAGPATPPASARPSTATPPDPAETAKAEALSAYKGYWTEMPKALSVRAIEGTDLKRYAAAEALSKAEVSVGNLKRNGRITTGEPVVTNSTVTAAELEKKTPNVSVSSCLDISKWKIVDKQTGEPAPGASSPVSRYVVVSLMERWDGAWKVLKDDLRADQPC
ncbi:hypothetical protein [Streptomyces sp. NPDC001502]|uniref:hypothetical protein n=1 Tax=Streptomyces sp. NPDC001502 TaxID=3364578 RepID=UPI0036927F00